MRRFWFLLLLVCATSALNAQTFNLQSGREPIASLDGLWRFHTGDNPAWASPAFDDSNWPLIRSDESWAKQGYPGYSGYAWYRFTVLVPDGSKAWSLLLGHARTGYQVFLDGRFLNGYGSMASPPGGIYLMNHVVPIPTSVSGPRILHISIRVWHNPEWVADGGFYTNSYIGGSHLIDQRAADGRQIRMNSFVNDYAYAVVGILVGLTVLVLFFIRSSEREYLWFALLLLTSAAGVALPMAYFSSLLTSSSTKLLAHLLQSGALFSALMFFSIVLRADRSKAWWVSALLLAVNPFTSTTGYFDFTTAGVGIGAALNLLCCLPASLWILIVLIQRAIRKDKDALLLLVPTLLWQGFQLIDAILNLSWRFGMRLGNFYWSPVSLSPYRLMPAPAIDTLFVLALLIFLIRRFSLARREEERLSGEFEAARGIQSLLIPEASPVTPGFSVETVYLPASEVGGDFFQVLPADDGSLLVVVGDVSGKGLKAAMTVSAIVGALRGCTLRKPSEVLAYLNRVLHGQITGFATCTAASIHPDGTLTLANAGNLAPYRNGEELPIDSGLPLGIIAESDYSETTYHLEPGDRLTFVSDGVVEATNAQRELFGFDRTQAISSQSANAIAQAAKQFGQQDDISVLSITRALAVKPAAVPALA